MGSCHAEDRRDYSRRRKRPLPSLSLCSMLVWALALLAVLVLTRARVTAAQSSDEISVGSFIDDETLNACRASLEEADANGDGDVSATEYIAYVKRETSDIVSEETFSDIPLPLVMLFIRYACKCVSEPDPSPGCCQGSNAHLNIADDGSAQRLVYLIDFCLDAIDAVAEVKESASVAPTYAPTSAPTEAPTASDPTPAPTAAPTVEGQMSIKLQYKLTNEDGLDAYAVLNGINNTLKSNLVVATRTIVIETLDGMMVLADDAEAKPRAPVVNNREHHRHHVMRSSMFKRSTERGGHDRSSYGPGNGAQHVGPSADATDRGGGDTRQEEYMHKSLGARYLKSASASADARRSGSEERVEWDDGDDDDDDERPLRLGDDDDDDESIDLLRVYHRARRRRRRRRRLVIYTDDLPVEIYRVIDNPDCPTKGDGGDDDDLLRCLIIFTRIRVILEEGDDRSTVREAVSGGMRRAFEDGSFLGAIPEEGRRLAALA